MKTPTDLADNYPKVTEWLSQTSRPLPPGKSFWETELLSALAIVEARPEKLVYELKLQEHHCSQYLSIHSGFMATSIDICNHFVMGVHQGKNQWQWFGMTSDISISFLRSMRAGQTARFECHVYKVSKNIAHIHTKVYDADNGDLCCTATFVKVRADYKHGSNTESKL
ncbi:HotDog domain-containing protein [Fennellomyces sp. T-0311]|nr:HotDog domain-containing protein [Fennellomyces sp. T-0311]